ncbi:MAG: universal stress protein [Chitinophagaceae bacterium]|nr:universal stress protein [Chitinophagaceae bacterium]
MKKILVAFDGTVFSEGALEYAFHLSGNEGAMIVGVFIEDLSYVGYATLFGEDYFTFNAALLEKMEHEDDGKFSESISKFESICKQRGISYQVHLDKGVPVNELVRESLFADLIVIGYRTFFSNVMGEASFLKDVLLDAECPVMAVPDQFNPMESLLLSFDGKAPSVYAIKQFTQLFPNLSQELPATILSITRTKEEVLDYQNLMQEYISIHYRHVETENFTGEAEEAILNIAERLKNPLIIMGAFGRNAVSRFFSRSAASKLLKNQSLPIFVSHK